MSADPPVCITTVQLVSIGTENEVIAKLEKLLEDAVRQYNGPIIDWGVLLVGGQPLRPTVVDCADREYERGEFVDVVGFGL